MATILLQITDRLVAIVTAAVPAGVAVWQDRDDAISREEAPGVNQVIHELQPESFADGWEQVTLEIDLQIHVRAEPATPAQEAIHQAIHAPIVNDTALKALADSIRLIEGIPNLAGADETAGRKTARYRFKFLNPTDSL